MSVLPTEDTPLNQHSIRALEHWLSELGATVVDGNPCLWSLQRPHWTAQLQLDREDLVVIWQWPGHDDKRCALPYGLSRHDVQAAIEAGP